MILAFALAWEYSLTNVRLYLEIDLMMNNNPIKISQTEFLILRLMIREGRDLYGLGMVKSSKNKLKRGTIYTTLSRMEDKGLITSTKESTIQKGLTAKRRMYNIAGLGVISAEHFQNNLFEIMGASYA